MNLPQRLLECLARERQSTLRRAHLVLSLAQTAQGGLISIVTRARARQQQLKGERHAA